MNNIDGLWIIKRAINNKNEESGAEIVIVVEEWDKSKARECHEHDWCEFETLPLSFYVECNVAGKGEHQQNDSERICCENTIADDEWDEKRLKEEQLVIQLYKSIFMPILIIVLILSHLLFFSALRIIQFFAFLHSVTFLGWLLILLLLFLLLVVKLIYQFVLLLILVIAGIAFSQIFIGFFLITHILKFVVFYLFVDSEDGECEVEDEK